MDMKIRGIVFHDVDKAAKSTYVDPYRGLHTEVMADLDTGRLYVTEVGGDDYTISTDPHVIGVGIGKMSVDELVSNIEDNIDYFEETFGRITRQDEKVNSVSAFCTKYAEEENRVEKERE